MAGRADGNKKKPYYDGGRGHPGDAKQISQILK